MKKINSFTKSKIICCDGNKVNLWSPIAKKYIQERVNVITLWFLLHEISNFKIKLIEGFLKKIKKEFPNSEVIICELIKAPDSVLLINKEVSVIPEYLFFHDLSNQGVLSWEEIKLVIKRTGYKLIKEYLFDDLINIDNNTSIPSTCVLILKP